MFRVQICAGHDGGRIDVVLVVAGAGKSTLGAGERILSRGHSGELELAIVGGNDGLRALPRLHTGENHASVGERMFVGFADNSSRNSKGSFRGGRRVLRSGKRY